MSNPSREAPIIIDRGPVSASVLAASPIELAAGQWQQLARFRDLLLGWNERVNLTAVRQPEDVERLLFLDALRMVLAIRSALAREAIDGPKLIDVGTGAGFPGLPLAIAMPEIAFTLLDATGKKIAFIGEAVRDLALENVTPLHGRSEEISHDRRYREQFDFATARAVSSLPTLAELVIPLLRPGGRAFFPKSADLGDELDQGRRAASMLGARLESDVLLPHEGDEKPTRLIVIRRGNAPLPAVYPRRAGIPAKEPLGIKR